MAKMIPPYCDPKAPASEKGVFQRLKADRGAEGWTVLHSLALAGRGSDDFGEIDFVVIIPREGIVCLEVKGGRVSCRGGVWWRRTPEGRDCRMKKSPFQQVRDAMIALQGAIRGRFPDAPESRCPMGYAVVFPDVRALPQTAEFDRSDVLYEQDLKQIATAIGRLVLNRMREQQPSGSQAHPAPRRVEAIRKFLRPEFYRVPALSARIERAEKELLSLTEEQYDRLDDLEVNPRCLFEGAAGTGKTLLAVEYARRRAREGDRVLLVCFNRLLGAWLREQVDEEATFTVGAWHDVLKDIICAGSRAEEFLARENALKGQGDVKESGLYDEEYPQHARSALKEREKPPFDAVIVDEAQDLIVRREFLPLLDLAVHGGLGGGRWTMFGDFTRQALFGREVDGERDPVAILQAYGRKGDQWAPGTRWWSRLVAKLPAGSRGGDESRDGLQFFRAGLRRNCRNTRSIAEATAAIAGFETPPFRTGADDGIPVEAYYWGSTRWEDVLAGILERLLKTERLPAEDIMLLAPGTAERNTLTTLGEIAGQKIVERTADLPADSPGIRVTTIHAFKGMESRVVIIPGLKRDLDEWRPSLLYVGMSRARSLLVLIAHEEARNALERRMESVRRGQPT